MHPRALAVEPLHAIDSQVPPAVVRIRGVNERQGEKGASVKGPAGEHGQLFEVGQFRKGLENGPFSHFSQSCFGDGSQIAS